MVKRPAVQVVARDVAAAGVRDQDAPEQLGIQSLETGMRLLTAMATLSGNDTAPMLKDIAAAAEMPAAKAHRYMVSLIRAGFAEREPASGRYRLGRMARQLGIGALQGLNVVRIAGSRLPEIRDALQQTVALAIWALHGPTIVQVEEVGSPVMISTRVGQVMPILRSATGRVFGAWGTRSLILPLLERELASGELKRPGLRIASIQDAERLLDRMRRDGVGHVKGTLNPMISSLSAPIFDHRGSLVAALSALGPADGFDAAPDSQLAKQVVVAADRLSLELGFLAKTATQN